MKVASSSQLNTAPAVAIDPTGKPWVVWSQKEGVPSSIYSSHFDGEKWTREVRLTAVDDREDVTPSLAFDAKGNAVLAWGSVLGATSSEIRIREWDGEKWGKEETLTNLDVTPDMVPVVAFNRNGNAVVVWVGNDEQFTTRLYSSWKDSNKGWSAERLVEIGDPDFSQDLPTLKVEGESIKLYYEDGNRVFATDWNGRKWTRRKFIDLSNAFYGVFDQLKGNPQGRAWFAWTNRKGKAISFRYNIVTHDLALEPQSLGNQYFSATFKKAFHKLGQAFAWVMGEKDAYAGGKKKGSSKFGGSRAVAGDSITAGGPGISWVVNYQPNAQEVVNVARGGARATSQLAGQVRRVPEGTQVLVILCGTNDIGDGRGLGDIIGALNNAAVGVGQNERGVNTSHLCTGVPRLDIFAGSVAALADTIRSQSAVPVIETFNPLNGNPEAFAIDGVGHLNQEGANAVGSVVTKSAKPRN